MHRSPCASALFAVVTLLAANVHAQVIDDRPSCPRCRIIFRPQVILGIDEGDGSLAGPPQSVLQDSKGRFWVIGAGLPRLFNRDGSFLTVLGNRGRGPGEFELVLHAFKVPGDSVVVVDAATLRASVLDADLRFIRAVTMSSAVSSAAVLSWPDAVIVNLNVSTPAGAGRPLHVASFTGERLTIARSFGGGDTQLADPFGLTCYLTAPHSGQVWAGEMLAYDLSRVDANGRVLQTIERRPSWFATRSRYGVGNPQTPPPPALAGIQEDSAGLVRVFVRVAARDWRSAWPRLPAGVTDMRADQIRFEELFDTTVEVIDPDAKRVVARQTFRRPGWPLGAGKAAFYTVTESGSPRISIGELEVRR